jgi:hypothetical protein
VLSWLSGLMKEYSQNSCGQWLIYELLQGKDLARRKIVLAVVKLFLLYE